MLWGTYYLLYCQPPWAPSLTVEKRDLLNCHVKIKGQSLGNRWQETKEDIAYGKINTYVILWGDRFEIPTVKRKYEFPLGCFMINTLKPGAYFPNSVFLFWQANVSICFTFHWNFFLRFQLTMSRPWFVYRFMANRTTDHQMNKLRSISLTRISIKRLEWIQVNYNENDPHTQAIDNIINSWYAWFCANCPINGRLFCI